MNKGHIEQIGLP